MPLTKPVPLTVATEVAVLLQVPLADASVKGVADEAHNVVVPVIKPDTGNGFTVTTMDAADTPQPFVTVYDIMDVPADTPLIVPVPLMVVTDVLVLLQIPPADASLRGVVLN